MKTYKIAIVGAGVVGTALAVLLREKGYKIAGIASRREESLQKANSLLGGDVQTSTTPSQITPEADIVFITTSDGAIQDVCDAIARDGGFRSGQIVVHTSGALPSTILASAQQKGALIASVHPLQSFADVKQAVKILPASIFNLEGDVDAIAVLKALVEQLGGKPITIQTVNKPLYHAAAVLACNFFVTLVYLSYQLFEAIELTQEVAAEALLPLIKGTVNNIEHLGPVKALTGPIARGDVGVIKGHLEALKMVDPRYKEIYRAISRLTVEIGIKKGTLRMENAEQIMALLEG